MGEEGLGWWLMMALGVAFVSLGGCVGVAVYLCVSLSLSLFPYSSHSVFPCLCASNSWPFPASS